MTSSTSSPQLTSVERGPKLSALEHHGGAVDLEPRLLIHHDHDAVIVGYLTRTATELLDAGLDPYDLPERLAHARASALIHARNSKQLITVGALIGFLLACAAPRLFPGVWPWNFAAALALVCVGLRALGEPPARTTARRDRRHPDEATRPDACVAVPLVTTTRALTTADLPVEDLDRLARLAATCGTSCGNRMLLEGDTALLADELQTATREVTQRPTIPGIGPGPDPRHEQAANRLARARALADTYAPAPLSADHRERWIAADGHDFPFTMRSFAGQLPTFRDTLIRWMRRA